MKLEVATVEIPLHLVLNMYTLCGDRFSSGYCKDTVYLQ